MSIQGEERRYRGREKNNGKGATFSFGGAREDQQGIMAERARTPNLMPKCSWGPWVSVPIICVLSSSRSDFR